MVRGFDVGVAEMRTELVRRHVAPEMLALSIVELVLTFALACIMLTPSPSSLSLTSIHFAMMCALTVGFTAFSVGLYRPQMFERAQKLVLSTILSALLSFPAVWLVSKGLGLSSYWPVGYDPFRPVKIVFIWCIGLLGIRLVFLFATRLNLFVHRVAIVGEVDTPGVVAALTTGRKGFLEISVLGPERDIISSVTEHKVRTLVVVEDHEKVFAHAIVKQLQARGVRIQSPSEFWERHLRRVDIANIGDTSLMSFQRQELNCLSRCVSRMFDLIASLGLLVATLPIIFIVALIVRLDSSGSVLYRQERVGIDNSRFTLLKFRSMKIDAEALGPRWAQQRDPRVTRVGQFLRRTRIDELPQLWNILRGEMSFIGPRPERPHFVDQLSQVIPHYEERSRVKPGLTGWAQVNYPYGASVEDARAKLSYDLYYVKNRTILLDFLILLSTVRVILHQEGSR